MALLFLNLFPKIFVRNASSSSINSFTLRTHNCGELRLEHVGHRVKIYGWLETKRMDKQSSVCVEGTVLDRGKDRNNKIPTGQIEIDAEKIEVFNSIPNALPVYNSSTELTRLTHRYLDLRSEKMQLALRFRAQIISKMRRFLEDECAFVDIQTPTLSHFTPGGANEFPVPANDSGEFFSLPQSPQIYKQLLMCGGIDKYYQVAICYRDEPTKPNRQPEFTQLDLELSFSTQEKIICLIEQILINSWPKELEQYKPTVPFPRMDYSEARGKRKRLAAITARISQDRYLPLWPFPRMDYSEAV
uniref:Aminoacyl-transfer RNA synthetases class-II family profile domain-containing protein n=1 Tax=Meloidogyne incognita TaxID=6306 RepID=A0A914LF47_MELIC